MINRLAHSLSLDTSVLRQLDHASLAFIILWLITMILFPIAYWIAGDAVIPPAITIAALAQSIAVFYPLSRAWGSKRAVMLFMLSPRSPGWRSLWAARRVFRLVITITRLCCNHSWGASPCSYPSPGS